MLVTFPARDSDYAWVGKVTEHPGASGRMALWPHLGKPSSCEIRMGSETEHPSVLGSSFQRQCPLSS